MTYILSPRPRHRGHARRALPLAAFGLLALLVAPEARAEPAPSGGQAARETRKIRDNLFLMEEAYNQEPGVIQHIQSFRSDFRADAWAYSFTEEWPAPTDLNQLSVTLPVEDAGEAVDAGIGDVLVTYRIQALGLGGRGKVAMAPRISLALPTGDETKERGHGTMGVQLAAPVSMDLSDYLVLHTNLGVAITPESLAPTGGTATTIDGFAGAALVVLPVYWFNLLTEALFETTETATGEGATERERTVTINPGVRFAIDVGDLQVVPGASVPIELPEEGEQQVGVLGYLSFEHPAF